MQAAIQEEEQWQAEEAWKAKEAKEHQKAKEAKRLEAVQRKAAEEKKFCELEVEKKQLEEETCQMQQVEGSSSQHVASGIAEFDNFGDVDRCLGEIIKAIKKSTAVVESMLREVQDLSGVLEESFEVLKTAMTTLINWAIVKFSALLVYLYT
ncbi:hypothetical protein EDD17DRAFT_1758221 [Pisolithus thermaeus]|nr:hypothetical protein EV401DRAFT_2064616 [Pisolithus croceorrhizus]KAI6161946.1 hypothetical protein EDD17DRAFT_1758221 [Pisolithus thermaeus]